MKKKIFKTILLFSVGFCVYITIEVLFRGFSFAVSGLLGGTAIVVLDKINDRISWDIDILVQGLIGSALITFLEFIVGVIAKYTNLLPVMWDYSNLPLNLDGIICLPFSIAWIGLSLIAIFVADTINYFILHESPMPYYRLFHKIIVPYA